MATNTKKAARWVVLVEGEVKHEAETKERAEYLADADDSIDEYEIASEGLIDSNLYY